MVVNGVVQTAANVDKSWIGTDADDVISAALGGQRVTVLNDADAAGLAEERYGAGPRERCRGAADLRHRDRLGGDPQGRMLLPNTEFGHLEVDGKEAEHRAASSVKERKDWSYPRWSEEVTKVLITIENPSGPTCSSPAAASAGSPRNGFRC